MISTSPSLISTTPSSTLTGLGLTIIIFDLSDSIMDPPLSVQQELHTSGDRIQSMRDQLRESLASRYGVGSTDALRRSLGLTVYTSGTSRKGLGSSTVKALQQADFNPPEQP